MWQDQGFQTSDSYLNRPSYNNENNWNAHGLNHGWDQPYPSSSLGSQSYNSGVSGGGDGNSLHLRQISQPDMRGLYFTNNAIQVHYVIDDVIFLGPMLDSTYNMFNDAQVQQSQRFAASYNNPDSKSPPFHQRPQWNHKMN